METTTSERRPPECGCEIDVATGVVAGLCPAHTAEAQTEPPPQVDASETSKGDGRQTALSPLPVAGALSTAAQFRAMLDDEAEKRAALLAYIRRHFREGIHYSRIGARWNEKKGKWVPVFYAVGEVPLPRDRPGKPCLLQSGAQTATLVMQCKAVFSRDDETLSMLPDEARGRVVAIRCTIVSKATGEVIGEGRGACSLGEKDDNINSVIQIACKRAHVCCARTAFALSDLFGAGSDEMEHAEPNGDPPDAPPPDTTRSAGASIPKPAPGAKVKRPSPKVPSPPGAGAAAATATRSPPVADGPAPAPAGDGSQVEPDAAPPPDDGRVRSAEIPALLEACGTDADRAGVVISYLRGAKHPKMFDAMWAKAFKLTEVKELPPECKERIRTEGGRIKTALAAAPAADEPLLKESWQ